MAAIRGIAGTQQDNMTDKQQKGRCGKPPTWGGPTHCPHGHERTPENTITTSRGYTQCRACKLVADKAAYRKRVG